MTKFLNKTNLVLWLLLPIAVIVFFYGYWHYSEIHPATDDAYINGNIIDIAAEVSGPATKVYVKNNQLVTKGDALFDIDPQPFQLSLDNAKAQLQLTKQKVNALQDAIVSAQAHVRQAEAELVVDEKNAERIMQLVHQGKASKSSGDEATAKLAITRATLDAAKSDVDEAQQNLGATDGNNAQIQSATALLKRAQLDLAHTHLTAPETGSLANFSLRPGTMISQGKPLFSIVENNSWWIEANFKETDLARIKPGQPASFTIDMYPHLTFNGIVESISNGSGSSFSIFPAENATGNWVKVTQRFPVRIKIQNNGTTHPFRIGASAYVKIDTTKVS